MAGSCKNEVDCLLLELYMCRCKEWLNINLVRSYNTALLKEMRFVYLTSHTVLPLSCLCFYWRRFGLVILTQYQSEQSACAALDFLYMLQAVKRLKAYVELHLPLPLHTIRSEKMLAYVALHFPSFTYCKQWNNEGRNILFSIFTRAPVCKLLINYPIVFYTVTVLNC